MTATDATLSNVPEVTLPIRVWQLTDSLYYAGPELEGCILRFLNDDGEEEDLLDPAVEITAEELANTPMQEDQPTPDNNPRTMQQVLDGFIADNQTFPLFFATTDY